MSPQEFLRLANANPLAPALYHELELAKWVSGEGGTTLSAPEAKGRRNSTRPIDANFRAAFPVPSRRLSLIKPPESHSEAKSFFEQRQGGIWCASSNKIYYMGIIDTLIQVPLSPLDPPPSPLFRACARG
jgi:hypothetical protein